MKKIREILSTILIITMILPLFSCSNASVEADTPHSRTGLFFDTVITITLYGDSAKASKRLDAVFKMAEKYDNMFSATKGKSDISRINNAAGQPVRVHRETIQIIRDAVEYSKKSDGIFDLTVGDLSDLWDFKNNTGTVPDRQALNQALKHVDYRNVEIDGSYVCLKDPDSRIDLGGIAKGFIADKIKKKLEKMGAKSGIINLGGNVLLIGNRPDGKPYTVGIQRPFSDDGTALFTLQARDMSIVTSGTYQRYFEKNGRIYHHILNLSTGYPYNNGLDSVTIITKRSTKADALSTTVFAMGLKKGLEYVNSLKGVEAVFVKTNGEIIKSYNVDRLYKYTKLKKNY